MGVVIKQSFFSLVGAYIGLSIGYFNAMILMPYFMSPEEIGLVRTVLSMAMLLSPIATFGMGNTIIRFYPKLGGDSIALSKLTTFALIVIVSVFFVLSGVIFSGSDYFLSLFEEKSVEINQYIGVIVVLSLQIALFNLSEIALRTQKSIILPNLVRELLYKFLHAVIIILYGLNLYGFRQYMYGQILIYLILIITLLFPIISKYKVRFDPSLFNDKETLSSIFSYASVSILTFLGLVVIVQIDQIMVTKYLGLAAGGIYAMAINMSIVVEMPRKFINQIASPIISEFMTSHRYEEVNDIYKKASINQMILGAFIFLLIIINLDSIYLIIPNGSKYLEGKNIVLIVGLMKVMDMTFSMSGEIISYSKYYRLNFISLIILSTVAVIGNFFLIPKYGINGAAIASLITYFIFNMILFGFIKWKFNFSPFSINTLKVLVVSLSIFLLISLIPFIWNSYIDLVVRSSIFALLFIVTIYSLNISEEINKIIQEALKRIKNQLL